MVLKLLLKKVKAVRLNQLNRTKNYTDARF
jgi:hypothetical protein